MKVVFTYNSKGQPPDYGPIESSPTRIKLADASLVFEASDGPLQGMVLVGFTVWRQGDGSLIVNEPWRQILAGPMKGARYSLLRPQIEDSDGLTPPYRTPVSAALQLFIMDAFDKWERIQIEGARRLADAMAATETTIPLDRAVKEWPRLKRELDRVERSLPPEYVEFLNRPKKP